MPPDARCAKIERRENMYVYSMSNNQTFVVFRTELFVVLKAPGEFT